MERFDFFGGQGAIEDSGFVESALPIRLAVTSAADENLIVGSCEIGTGGYFDFRLGIAVEVNPNLVTFSNQHEMVP